jgi:hypothetical protein
MGNGFTPEVEREREKVTTLSSLPRSTTCGLQRQGKARVSDAPEAGYSYARRRETLVAFTSAKTLSPGLSSISWTERVVMIDAISPMLVSTITSLRTLSDTTLFTVPGSWLRMLSSISCEDSPNEIGCQRQPAVDDTRLQRYASQAAYDR